MTPSFKTTMLALVIAGFSGGAAAQMAAFETVDADGDGFITPGEAALVEGLDLAALDTDGDGKLSPDEYAAASK
jgi:hypothetical protein